MRNFHILLVAAFALFTANAQSVDDGLTVTGEKGLISVLTADTVPDGKFSFGVNHHNVDRDLLDVDIVYYSVTFGYGITDNLEFVAAVLPYAGYDVDLTNPSGDEVSIGTINGMLADTHHYRDGFGDISIGAKYVFVRGGNYGVGVRGFIKIPTANEEDGVGTGKPDFGFDFIVSGTAGGVVGVAANVGVELRGDPDFRRPDGSVDASGVEVNAGHHFRWGVGANFPADSSVQGIVELSGFTGFSNDQNASLLARYPGAAFEYDDATDLTAGLRFRCGSNWYFTAAGRWNLEAERDNAQYPYGGSFQLAYAPGRAVEELVPPPPPRPAPPPLPAPPAPPAPAPPEFVWPEVYFPFDQYILTGETRTKLDSVAGYMTDHPNVNVTVEGHCCYIGTDEYNLALGQHRTDAIKDYLVGKGISASRLRTVSYGESRPKYDNSKEITRRFNRRGFFVVIRPE